MSITFRPLHVLAVDDDTVLRQLMELMLTTAGHTVTLATCGEEALALVSVRIPDVVLCDLQMPGLSGTPLLLRLRSACPPPARLIAISGAPLEAAHQHPIDGFLLKPFTPARLIAALVTRTPPPPEEHAPARLCDEPLDDIIYTRLSASMPPARLASLYAFGLEDAAARVDTLHTHHDAGDHNALRREAHALKGSAAMLGAAQLRALAGALEAGTTPANPTLQQLAPALHRLRRMLLARIPELAETISA